MGKPISASTPAEIVERLTAQVRRIEGLHHCGSAQPGSALPVSTGCAALDRLLPGSGLRRGTLVEWLAPAAGSGTATLALIAARAACREERVLAVLDPARGFYPPAAAALAIDLERLLIVRPGERRDDSWALDQLLRSPAVGAVLAWPGDWEEAIFRRLQLAAETGGGLGFLLRPGSVRAEPSWAEVRLWAVPLAAPALPRQALVLPREGPAPRHAGRCWRIEILKVRGGQAGGIVDVELDERTGTLHEMRPTDSLRLAPRVAAAAARRRSSGA